MLFRGEGGGGGVSWGVLIPTVLTISLFFIFVAGIVFRSHLRRSPAGAEGMVGERGVTVTALSPEGQVHIHGEYWHAVSADPIGPKEPIEVLEVIGLKLRVRRVEKLS